MHLKHVVKIFLPLLMLVTLSCTSANASVEPWYINDPNASGYKPKLVMNNQLIADKINKSINDYIYSQLIYISHLDTKEKPTFNYMVAFEDDSIISLLMTSNLTETHGLTFSKTSGDKLRREYFVKLTDKNIQHLVQFPSHCYVVTTKNIFSRDVASAYEFNQIKDNRVSISNVSNDFFLLGNGEIALIYPNNLVIGKLNEKTDMLIMKFDSGQVKYYNFFNTPGNDKYLPNYDFFEHGI